MSAVWRAWQALGWRHWAGAIAVGLLLNGIGLMNEFVAFSSPTNFRFNFVINDFLSHVMWGPAVLLCIHALEALRPRPGWLAYFGACVIASGVYMLFVLAWDQTAIALVLPDFRSPSTLALLYPYFTQTVGPGFLATIVYVAVRRAREAKLALSQLQDAVATARAAQMRQELLATQAGLRPDEIARELRQIALSYETSATKADELLDALIRSLRTRLAAVAPAP